MTDPNAESASTPPAVRGFPFVTVAATLATLFAFLGLTMVAYRSPNGLDVPKPGAADATGEPKPDAAAKLDEVKARNEAALGGVGAKMSQRAARDALLPKLKGPNDTLPFPTPEPATNAAPAARKDDKKDDKGKNP